MSTCVVSSLGFAYGEYPVLGDVSFSADPGELVCIVGPNGSGKTTLLHCLAGEAEPVSGQVLLDGQVPRSLPPGDRAGLRSFLEQTDRTDVAFPVRTVVGFGTFATGMQTADPIVDEAMRAVEVDTIADRLTSSLSGGERRRVSVARALAQQAPVMILDEPTDSLDLAHGDMVMREASAYAADRRLVIASSHDLNLAAKHADKVLVLHEGSVTAFGAPSTVLTGELLSHVYRCEVRVMPHPDDGRPLIFL
ncbi:MAG: ABC transporter ATP-binding protein [Acidimicrobiia bacterium]